jgi:hypothetical protein
LDFFYKVSTKSAKKYIDLVESDAKITLVSTKSHQKWVDLVGSMKKFRTFAPKIKAL